MSNLLSTDPEIAKIIEKELKRETSTLELIASENFTSEAVMEAQGSILTNKYAEGYPDKRYYGGCVYVDEVEKLAISRARELFQSEHVNVQPHSGSQANMAVYQSLLKPGDTVMGMNLSHGGHLTHGSPVNFSGSLYNFVSYGVNKEERIDYDEVEILSSKHKPKLIVVGASAYPRSIDYKAFRTIADKVGAKLFADIAHTAGLVAAKVVASPVPYADFVTTTTHKTLRGPRGGMIMCRQEYAKKIDKAIFPGIQGGPLMHIIAAKAVAFKEALSPGFVVYQKQVMANAQVLGVELEKQGFRLVSGGTDTHLLLVDLSPQKITGKDAEEALDKAGITVNKNTIPFEKLSPFVTSGIRLGTPALTTRGMKEEEMQEVASLIGKTLHHIADASVHKEVRDRVNKLCQNFSLRT